MDAATSRSRDPLDAGDLRDWLAELRGALRSEGDTNVPCGECTACCEASQFIHVAPDEAETLAHIPGALLFPAPGAPPGHLVMGFGEHGRCPMLRAHGCSIYEHRPRTCRTYDCRVFAATRVVPAGPGQTAIAERARRWRFTVRNADDEALLVHLRAAADELARTTDRPPTARALAAIERTATGDSP
jgi:Fe-S-cluster containining protein